jgi:chromosome segregation ATPase
MAAWTDERLDTLAASLRPLPAEVAKVTEAVARLTEETRSLRRDLTQETRSLRHDLIEETSSLRRDLTEETRSLRHDMTALRQDLSASQRQIAQIGWLLAFALLGAIAALVVALL